MIRQTVLLDEKGVTLIEVMIALLVMLMVSLAMMQTALVSIDANMTNLLRDEAVGIAEDTMSQIRNRPAGSLTAGSSSATVQRSFRNISALDYTIATTITDDVTTIGTAKRIDITVSWNWKGNPYTHSISTLLRSQ